MALVLSLSPTFGTGGPATDWPALGRVAGGLPSVAAPMAQGRARRGAALPSGRPLARALGSTSRRRLVASGGGGGCAADTVTLVPRRHRKPLFAGSAARPLPSPSPGPGRGLLIGCPPAGEDLIQTRLLRGPRAEPVRSQSVARGVTVAAPSWSAEGWGAVGPQKTWRGAPGRRVGYAGLSHLDAGPPGPTVRAGGMWAPASNTHLPSLPGGRSVQASSPRNCLQTSQLVSLTTRCTWTCWGSIKLLNGIGAPVDAHHGAQPGKTHLAPSHSRGGASRAGG